jgi:hypothetical protein
VALLFSITVASAIDQPSPRLGPALLLRLEGVLTTNRADAEKAGFTATSFAFLGHGKDADRWLGVTDARTVGGDVPVLGKDVLDAVAPFDPSFITTGDPNQVTSLLALPPGTAIRIEGLVDRGSRTFMIRSFQERDAH